MKLIYYLTELLDTGNYLLQELDKDDPSVERLQGIYDTRASQIKCLNEETRENPIEHLNTEWEIEISKLFTSLQNKEEQINKKILALCKKKEEQLMLLNQNSKAENRYRDQQKSNSLHLLNKNLQG